VKYRPTLHVNVEGREDITWSEEKTRTHQLMSTLHVNVEGREDITWSEEKTRTHKMSWR